MKLKLILAALSAGVLVACGGGGGSGAGDAPVVPQAWQTAQFLENSNSEAFAANAAINADGVGYAVWQQFEGTSTLAFARSYRNGVWSPAAEKITGADPVIVSNPKVVVLPDGEALAVWQETFVATGTEGVRFNRTQGGVWQEPDVVLDGVGNVEDLVLRANAQGAAMAVWNQQTTLAAKPSIHGAAFRNGVFEAVQPVSFGTSATDNPDIAIDADGNVLAVWQQFNGNLNFDTIHVRNYEGGFWKGELEVATSASASDPSVAVGLNGAAVVAWEQAGEEDLFVRTTPNFRLGQWDFDAVNLTANEEGNTTDPRVVLDHLGTATVVWQQGEDASLGTVRSLRSSRGKGVTFSAPEKVEVDDAGSTALQEITLDASGRVMAVWQQVVGTVNSMFSNRLDPATGKWGTPELIEQEGGNSLFVSLAMNPSGRAIAAWEQDAGGSNVMANVFK